MKSISLAFEEADFERFEAWCKTHRMKRNSAVMALLDIAEGQDRYPISSAHSPVEKQSLTQPVDLKALKMSLGKKVLEVAEAHTGVAPVTLEGEELVKGEPVPTALESFYKNKQSYGKTTESQVVDYDDMNQDKDEY